MSDFNGLNPNGEWTLFVADVAGGGTARLDSWALNLTVIPVSESAHGAIAAALGLAAFAGWWRWRVRTED